MYVLFKMAFLYGPLLATGAYYAGSKLLSTATNATINYVFADVDSDIKELHTVQSILNMLKFYEGMKSHHPAYAALLDVKDALNQLNTVIERAKLRLEAHRGGYLTRFTKFNAGPDNILIEQRNSELLRRIKLFKALL